MPDTRTRVAAAAFDFLYGIPPDVVETQGKFLQGHPGTPVFSKRIELKSFAADLNRRLEELVYEQRLRTRKYGVDVAEEWPVSHTPPEIVGDYQDRVSKMMVEYESPTPPEDYDDVVEEDDGDEAEEVVEKSRRQNLTFSGSLASSPGPHRFPTPASSLPFDSWDPPSFSSSVLDHSALPSQDAHYSENAPSFEGKFPFLLARSKKRARSTNDIGDRPAKCLPLRRPFVNQAISLRRYLEAT